VSIGYNIILYKLNLNYKHSILELTQESEKQKVDLERINQQYRETIGLLETNRKDKEAIVESLNQLGLDYNNLSQRYSSTIDRANSLERLAQIDDELLKKYSKFYFLNENYLPVYLVAINTEYVEPGKKISLLPEVKFRLENMILTAKSEDINIFVNSGYRSFEEQKNLKSRYSQVYGSNKANQFSADQGYSEHQLGTTVDLSDGGGSLDTNFEKTKVGKWLLENSYKFGFVLSYPKNNKYYIYEPWHYRFVGLELAKYLHDTGKSFYDLDQKFIDSYKESIFK
jgi:D-alanyl-D-alanine carboxypeptidase